MLQSKRLTEIHHDALHYINHLNKVKHSFVCSQPPHNVYTGTVCQQQHPPLCHMHTHTEVQLPFLTPYEGKMRNTLWLLLSYQNMPLLNLHLDTAFQ